MSHWLDGQQVSMDEASKMMSDVLIEARADVLLILNCHPPPGSGETLVSLLDLIGDALLAYAMARAQAAQARAAQVQVRPQSWWVRHFSRSV